MNERPLRTPAEQVVQRGERLQSLAKLGVLALRAPLKQLLEEAVTQVSATLETEYTKILELLPDGQALCLRAGVGWQAGLVGAATVGAGTDSQAGYTLQSEGPVIVEDLRTETRFSGPALLHDHGVISGMSVIIHGRERPFGVLGTHTNRFQHFTPEDVHFIQAVANVLAAAIEQHRVETERQRAVEEERHRIARDLHDSVIQLLYSQMLRAEVGRRQARAGDLDSVADSFERVEYATQQALRELRLLVYELRFPVADGTDLLAALQERLDAVERRTGVDTRLTAKGQVTLPRSITSEIYKIAVEALNNTLKHAAATAVMVDVTVSTDGITLIVMDNGQGFNPASQGPRDGIGLHIMRERAERIGAEFRVDTAPGRGTTVRLHVPCSGKEPMSFQ